jgi:hypothetical protein
MQIVHYGQAQVTSQGRPALASLPTTCGRDENSKKKN